MLYRNDEASDRNEPIRKANNNLFGDSFPPSLFRSEVQASRSNRLAGDVAILVPPSWEFVGYLFASALIIATVFVSFATYARVTTVTGILAPEKGTATIVPSRAGTIAVLAVREGQNVKQGDPVALIRSEEDASHGASAAARIEAAIGRQDDSVIAQINANRLSSLAQQQQLVAQRRGLAAEIEQLQVQLSFQRLLVASAETDLNRARGIAERGFISLKDIQTREDALLGRQQVLAQITQTIAAKRAALFETERNASQSSALALAQKSSLLATRAQVAQQAASAEGSRSYTLRSPFAGHVTALTARVGQPASPQMSLMTIVPTNSKLVAELVIPSSVIGFVKPGQSVRLAIDAFPYQHFGTVQGRVTTVASASVSQAGSNGSAVSVYPAVVALETDKVSAFGRKEQLLAGMSLSARIVTDRQTLLQWLFEPIFAVQRR